MSLKGTVIYLICFRKGRGLSPEKVKAGQTVVKTRGVKLCPDTFQLLRKFLFLLYLFAGQGLDDCHVKRRRSGVKRRLRKCH